MITINITLGILGPKGSLGLALEESSVRSSRDPYKGIKKISHKTKWQVSDKPYYLSIDFPTALITIRQTLLPVLTLGTDVYFYSTVTLFARFLGLSTSVPRAHAV
jgi:hypothetical protein